MAIFDGLTEAEQVALLRETLATIGELSEVYGRLVAAYARRDLDALVQLNTMYRRWGSPELAARSRNWPSTSATPGWRSA